MSDHSALKARCLLRLDAALLNPSIPLAHKAADEALTIFLSGLGFAEIVEAYERITPKWYE